MSIFETKTSSSSSYSYSSRGPVTSRDSGGKIIKVPIDISAVDIPDQIAKDSDNKETCNGTKKESSGLYRAKPVIIGLNEEEPDEDATRTYTIYKVNLVKIKIVILYLMI